MKAVIIGHPEAVICSCQAIQVDTQGRKLSCTAKTGPGEAFFVPQEAIHYGMLLDQVPFGTPIQVAVKREAFLQTGGWDLSMTNSVEIDSWIRLADYGNALFVNKCLAYRTVWPGGNDQKIDLARRKETNFLIKQRIYERISAKYRDQVPSLTAIDNYLNLHWGLVALRQGKWETAASLCFPAIFSPPAWSLLRQARTLRGMASESVLIPKVPVIPA